MRLIVAAAVLFIATPAFAQQQQASPSEQALSAKLVREITESLQCSSNLITVNQKLDAAEKRVKELEDKYEKPKK